MSHLTVPGVRQTRSGRWEATISHPLLPNRRVFRVFQTEREATAYKLLMLAQLERGCLPTELARPGRRSSLVPDPPYMGGQQGSQDTQAASAGPGAGQPLADVIRAYLTSNSARIAPSDRPMVEYLGKTLRGTVASVTSRWADAWILSMKREERLAPGTIRKRVESLARCIDWWWREQDVGNASFNPLRVLPRGYSTYRQQELPLVAVSALPRDQSRTRRLNAGEYERIVSILQGEKTGCRQRPFAAVGDPELLLLFRLLVATALRLRERSDASRVDMLLRSDANPVASHRHPGGGGLRSMLPTWRPARAGLSPQVLAGTRRPGDERGPAKADTADDELRDEQTTRQCEAPDPIRP